MTIWTQLWLVWLVMFLAIEITAIIKKAPGDTFSEHVWKWAAVSDKPTAWVVRRCALVIFLLWLLLHFATHGQFLSF